MGGECSHRTLPFNQTDTNTWNGFYNWKKNSWVSLEVEVNLDLKSSREVLGDRKKC